MKNYRYIIEDKSFMQKIFNMITVFILIAFAFAIIPLTAQAASVNEMNNERLMLGSLCDCMPDEAAICHIPPGNHDEKHTIHIGDSTISAHLAHGDTLGACPGDIEEFTSIKDELNGACTCADGTAGNWYNNSPILTQDSTLRDIYGR